MQMGMHGIAKTFYAVMAIFGCLNSDPAGEL